MVSRVTVRVMGSIGVDDANRLLTELARATGLSWREEHPPDDTHLSGTGGLLLDAVISGAVGKAGEVMVEATVDRVREAVGRWREKRLDPPDVDVRAEELPEDDAAGESGDEPAAAEAGW